MAGIGREVVSASARCAASPCTARSVSSCAASAYASCTSASAVWNARAARTDGAPVQAPVEKKKRSKLVPISLCIAIPVVLIVIVAVASGGSKSATSTPTTVAGSTGSSAGTDESTPAVPDGPEHKVGETGTTSKWAVTLNAIKNPYVESNDFIKADPGTHFVALDMTVANNDTTQQPFSTLLQLSVTDAEAYKYTPTFAGTDLPQLGGDVAPGGANRGWVVFQVPDTANRACPEGSGRLHGHGDNVCSELSWKVVSSTAVCTAGTESGALRT